MRFRRLGGVGFHFAAVRQSGQLGEKLLLLEVDHPGGVAVRRLSGALRRAETIEKRK